MRVSANVVLDYVLHAMRRVMPRNTMCECCKAEEHEEINRRRPHRLPLPRRRDRPDRLPLGRSSSGCNHRPSRPHRLQALRPRTSHPLRRLLAHLRSDSCSLSLSRRSVWHSRLWCAGSACCFVLRGWKGISHQKELKQDSV